ncbi:MAG: hypothetical protein ACE5JC_10440 [Candidatus Zixiibacteriota bacterium]
MNGAKTTQATQIIAVVHENGQPALCEYHLNAIVWEVAEGRYRGIRGCDVCLHDEIGALQHDRTRLVCLETDRRVDVGEEIKGLPLFGLGEIRSTSGGFNALLDAGQGPEEFIQRHVAGDWGDLDDQDRRANEEALRVGNRLLSAYRTKRGERIWVITEWDRSATTILLPDEY